jgi:hypothetical protein
VRARCRISPLEKRAEEDVDDGKKNSKTATKIAKTTIIRENIQQIIDNA